jgi:hypothetical protein
MRSRWHQHHYARQVYIGWARLAGSSLNHSTCLLVCFMNPFLLFLSLLLLAPTPRRHDEEAEDEEHGGGRNGATSMAADLGWSNEAAPLTDVTVSPEEPLEMAGCLSGVMEGMLVVQAPENGRALEIG